MTASIAQFAQLVVGGIGIAAAAASAHWWLKASRVPPVYNTAVLGVDPKEVARIDAQAKFNSLGAIFAAVAVACQALYLAFDVVVSLFKLDA